MFLRNPRVWAADDGGAGGSAAPAGGAAQPNSDGGSGGGRRQTESELRAEAASWRVEYRKEQDKVRQLEEKLAQTESSSSKKMEETTRELQEKLDRANRRMLDTAIRHELVTSGLVDPDLVGLVTQLPSAPEVKLDAEGNVVGTKELVEAFKKWKPGFFQAASTNGSSAAGVSVSGGGSGGSAAIPGAGAAAGVRPTTGAAAPTPAAPPAGSADVRGLSKESYSKYKAEMMAAVRAGRAIPTPPTS